MCSPPLGESAEPASKKAEKKAFYCFSPWVIFFAHRHILDTHTKRARTSSVIYPPFADQTKTHINEKQHHNTVFLNTTAWDSHPHASPEGPGTTPSKKCQRWSSAGSLGAAMRLTALRQSPQDISGPMNSMQMKRKPNLNDPHSPHLCYCKYTSS